MAQVNTRNRKRADGSNNWEYRFETARVDGKRRSVSKSGFKTKKEALEAGTKALAEYNKSGLSFEPSEISVADNMDYWFDHYVKVNCKYKTQELYARIIEKRIKPNFGNYKLKSLTAAQLQEYVNDLFVETELTKYGITSIISVLSGSLKYAVLPARFIESSPMIYVKCPKSTERKREVNRTIISTEDFDYICEKFEGTPYYYALMVGFFTGMRIGEVYGLTWDDVDLENKTITVQHQCIKRNYGIDVRKAMSVTHKKEERSSWYVSSLKTKSSYRTIKIGDTLTKALKKYKLSQKENELYYGEYYVKQYLKEEKDEKGNPISRIYPCAKAIGSTLPEIDLVFRCENGDYSSSDSFKYAARIIHHSLGFKDFNFHSLRHTHATRLLEAGVSVKTVQKRLGHENIETTLQTYVHDTDEMAQSAVDSFEQIVGGKLKKVTTN